MVTGSDPTSVGRVPKSAGELARSTVIVVDDDALILSVVGRVLYLAGFTVETYVSGREMLAQARLGRVACVIVDMFMPEITGLQVQASLKQRNVNLPLICLSGSSDIEMAVEAMREGALDFIEKPFDNEDLVLRLRKAIDHHAQGRREELDRDGIARKLKTLTPRETCVLDLMIAGKTSKEAARNLGGSHRTIEVHRRHIMEKMEASHLAELVRMRLLVENESPAR
jgi:FixJ family two-component response regulator